MPVLPFRAGGLRATSEPVYRRMLGAKRPWVGGGSGAVLSLSKNSTRLTHTPPLIIGNRRFPQVSWPGST